MRPSAVLVLAVSILAAAASFNPEELLGAGVPSPGALSSIGGGQEHSPPLYRPGSQAYVVSQLSPGRPPLASWSQQGGLAPEHHNCLLCESLDSGACRSMPSCVFCEVTATALCDHAAPCLRCTVIKNPFFKCTPGEKYMDECDSCRCTDGHGGRCTHRHCSPRPLALYAMALSDGEAY